MKKSVSRSPKRRIISNLRTYTVANSRTLEQKIANAGPLGQRIDPHLITPAKTQLETLRQRYPNSDAELANKAKDKTMLGYHDIVVGNEPDVFLTRFLHEMLPDAIEAARDGFNN